MTMLIIYVDFSLIIRRGSLVYWAGKSAGLPIVEMFSQPGMRRATIFICYQMLLAGKLPVNVYELRPRKKERLQTIEDYGE